MFLFLAIMLVAHTAVICAKNMNIANHLENYFFHKSYGISAYSLQQFHQLLDNNLFHYYFQPIVNAKTGEIFAYEALMRTNPDVIGMVPLEILDIAAKEARLYEIEKLTFKNTLKIMQANPEIFNTKKLFINTIVSHQLTDEDFNKLFSEYAPLFKNIVMEIVVSPQIKDANLQNIHKRTNHSESMIALAEYGIGFCEEPDLLKINPNYVKIDRTLLRYINSDLKKQNYVSNLVQFAKQNNIKIIAEGIENYDEFEYVINLDIDYIQGFYTSKPNPDLIPDIPADLLMKLQKINHRKSTTSSNERIYETSGETELYVNDIAADRYSSIVISEKEITLIGIPNEVIELSLSIPDNTDCALTIENVSLQSTSCPSIMIGNNSSLVLHLVGDNQLITEGIRVPESATLIIIGDGNLAIHADHSNKVSIGGTDTQSYGNIIFAASGEVDIVGSGNISIGIGGGQNPTNSIIQLTSGIIDISTNGYTSVGIGSLLGNALIEIGACTVRIHIEGTKSVAIGSVVGNVNITSSGDLELNANGQDTIAIGSLDEGSGMVSIIKGSVNMTIKGHTGTGIGSNNGAINVKLLDGEVVIWGEGSDIVGIGDPYSKSSISILGGILSIKLNTFRSLPICAQPQKLIIDGGNIQCDFPEEITPVNSYGSPLVSRIITNTDEFSLSIDTVSYNYKYKARYSSNYPYIKVYLPDNVSI